MGMTYKEQCRGIVGKYRASGQPWPATAREMAAWAIRERLWAFPPSAIVSRCADDLATAMREEYITDPQGRRVRAKHAARIERGGHQMVLWADRRDASRQHMAIAFQQRRYQVVQDCFQLKWDVDSYNENLKPDRPIRLPLDFTLDVMEMEAAAMDAPTMSELPSEQSPAGALV